MINYQLPYHLVRIHWHFNDQLSAALSFSKDSLAFSIINMILLSDSHFVKDDKVYVLLHNFKFKNPNSIKFYAIA